MPTTRAAAGSKRGATGRLGLGSAARSAFAPAWVSALRTAVRGDSVSLLQQHHLQPPEVDSSYYFFL